MKKKKNKKMVCNPGSQCLSSMQKWAVDSIFLARNDFVDPCKTAVNQIIIEGDDSAAVWIFSDDEGAASFVTACELMNWPVDKVRAWIVAAWLEEKERANGKWQSHSSR